MSKLEEIELYAVSNHKTTDVFKCQPWLVEGYEIPANVTTKAQFERWATNPDLDHVFFSGYEGQSNKTRVSKSNPAYALRALVIDYDITTSIDEILTTVEKFKKAGWPTPNAISQTKSGCARTVYLLEAPVTLHSPTFTENLLKILKKHLRLASFLPGMDDPAYERVSTYYELGHNWLFDSEGVALSAKFIGRMVYEAAKKTSFRDLDRNKFIHIPLDIVEKEVHERFPGKWKDAFTLNARGNRFWEIDADAKSAIVTSAGMLCYTGDKQFVSWQSIFGLKFVEEYKDNRIGGAITDIFYDGKHYWSKNPLSELWESFSKDDIQVRLEVERRLSNSSQNGIPSEVKQAIVQIQNINRIQGALPFIYIPKPIIRRGGKRYLNISDVVIMAPEEGGPYYQDSFPWLANLYDLYFIDEIQLNYLLRWLQHFWLNAWNGTPAKGHALFLAGDTNQGKTLFGQVIASMIAGGHVDASSYLKGETSFNNALFQSALWTVDDTSPASDYKQKARFSAMVKKVIADTTFEMNRKFHDSGMAEWFGRLIVTCNLDPESIQVIPNLDISNIDKIMALMVATIEPSKKNFKPPHEMRAILEKELPFFLNFLQHWTPPDYIIPDTRYGFQTYIHPEIRDTAHDSNDITSFEELLTIFFKEFFRLHPKADQWKGNATQLHMQMMEDEAIKAIVSKLASVEIGRKLNKLLNTGFPIKRGRDGRTGRSWTVLRKDFE